MLNWTKLLATLGALAAITLLSGIATQAQVVEEDFNSVSGTGGGVFFSGAGDGTSFSWEDNITNEHAYAGTTGNTSLAGVSADGLPGGGVGGSGAGQISVSGASFDVLNEDFDGMSTNGSAIFLVGPGTNGYTPNWHDDLQGEAAFGGVQNGAVLVGDMTAEGCMTCGTNGTPGGRLVVNNVTVGAGTWYAGLAWDVPPFPGAISLLNPGFEDGSVAVGAPGWTHFETPYTEVLLPRTGSMHLKAWGASSGVYQDFEASEGQTWTATMWALNPLIDTLTGTQRAAINLEWYGPGGVISFESTTVVDSSTPTGMTPADYVQGLVTGIAPAGTLVVRLVVLTLNDGVGGGAAFFDDVTMELTGGSSVDLADFTLMTNFQGAAGAGETLGDVQLRLEDSDGDRLVFYGTADGNWQTLGAALNTATEADVDGNPASGVFNVNSPGFTAVIAFDDERLGGTRWGTGGTLTVDNVILGNTDSSGSNWSAGLYWPDLIVSGDDLSRLYLAADVKGDTPGGEYDLRIDCYTVSTSGLDEDFETAVGDCGASGVCWFLDWYDWSTDGITHWGTADWDSGIQGAGAYGGVAGLVDISTSGGFSAKGLTTGGYSSAKAAELRVEGIAVGPGGGWYAGLDWGSQGLASADLTQVELHAWIKGTTAPGGTLGDYELRLEDSNGDRRYFSVTANGGWQYVGGTLNLFAEGTALSGFGDGVFDLDSATYTVVVSFMDESASWGPGGVLIVDDLFLSPVDVYTGIGGVSFPGASNGSFQSVGGLMSQGLNAFGDLDETFNTVTAAGGFSSVGGAGAAGDPWDTGIEDEETFGGSWGTGDVGTMGAEGCIACGTNGSGAGWVEVIGASASTAGGWWAGLSWPVSPPDWRDLSLVNLTAHIKGTKAAPFMLRIEETTGGLANPVWLAFSGIANTTDFDAVGGPLSGATEGCPSAPCASFNYFAPGYKVTLVFEGATSATDWGSGGRLTIDNLHLDGITIGASDVCTVTLAYENEIASWGSDGTLTLDNLIVTPAGNADGDGDVDFLDAAEFMTCFAPAVPPGCEWANLDGDTDVDNDDWAVFLKVFGPPE